MAFVNAKAKIDIGYNESDFEYCTSLSEVFCSGVKTVVGLLREKGIIIDVNLFDDSEEDYED